jgi:hypothetical protein
LRTGNVRLRWWSWRVRLSAAVISMRLAPRHQTLRCPVRAGPPKNGERHANDHLAQALQFKCDGSGSSIDSNSGSSRKAGRNTGKRSPMSQSYIIEVGDNQIELALVRYRRKRIPFPRCLAGLSTARWAALCQRGARRKGSPRAGAQALSRRPAQQPIGSNVLLTMREES